MDLKISMVFFYVNLVPSLSCAPVARNDAIDSGNLLSSIHNFQQFL